MTNIWRAGAPCLSVVYITLLLFGDARLCAQAPPAQRAPVPLEALPERHEIVPIIDCVSLAQRDFSSIPGAPTVIMSAKVAPATEVTGESCAVAGYIAPQVQFQIALPLHGYGGRYLQAGCGGNCGFIPRGLVPFCANNVAKRGGFAFGSADSGHAGGGEVWAVDPALRKDFAYQADHKLLLAAQALITAYYGAPPAYNYFAGCSDGGREAMEEAQRFPRDFQGILAGSAAFRIAEAMEHFLWEAQKGSLPDGKPVFDRASVTLLHEAAIQACDELDGVKDGQIDDPRKCHFDPAVLRCKPGQEDNCLSAMQVTAAKDFYSVPTDAAGRRLYWGGEPYGDELSWPISTQGGHGLAPGFIRWMIYAGYPPAAMDPEHWQFTAESLKELATRGAVYDARKPDLRPFRDAGGKLILWQGTADTAAGNFSTLAYYQDVRDVVGGMNEARRFARVFLIPAVYHCAGGYVPYEEDLLGALVNWVEAAKAPEKIISAAYLHDGTLRTRPVFAYPAAAVYKGTGDINQAENFTSKTPAQEPDDHYDWLGAQYK